jgi:Beta-xylosidase
MHALETDAPFYWAPEVTYDNGKFYLYYSVGNEVLMHLRVAVSDRPDGGFVDSGVRLTEQDFAIDAHVFADTDGERYMFYATDFLNYKNIGTGTVVDKMVDWFRLAGDPKPVTRAKYDWQVYDPHRIEKGGVRWYTVEGPFVLKHKGLYFEMFSGGNWQNTTYGVSFAVSDRIEREGEWDQFSDGEKVLPIMRTLPGKVIGPGHNSVVRGPNNRELYCIYHRWTDNGRVLAIDRLDFAGARIFVSGPTYEPQIAPFQPTVNDHFDGNAFGENWTAVGEWNVTAGEAISGKNGEQRLICNTEADYFLCEVSVRAVKITETGFFGISLLNDTGKIADFTIDPKRLIAVIDGPDIERKETKLSENFQPDSVHLIRVELNEQLLKISLDGLFLFSVIIMDPTAKKIALATNNVEAAFSAFALTEGFEDLFETDDNSGWRVLDNEGTCFVEDQKLIVSSIGNRETRAIKMRASREYDFAADIRLAKYDDEFSWGFVLIGANGKEQRRIEINSDGTASRVNAGKTSKNLKFPDRFEAVDLHQFSVLIKDGQMIVRLEDIILGKLAAPRDETSFGVFCKNATVAVGAARLTTL